MYEYVSTVGKSSWEAALSLVVPKFHILVIEIDPTLFLGLDLIDPQSSFILECNTNQERFSFRCILGDQKEN